MIQAVSDTCSVRWTKVNHKVYKFQSLVFNEDKNQVEELKLVNTLAPTSPSVSNAGKINEQKQNKQLTNQQVSQQVLEESSACSSQSKITGPIQWKQVYGEYLGKELDYSEVTRVSPKISRKCSESSSKIARKSPESLFRHCKDFQDVQSKKDQRRVHFEDEVGVKSDEEDDVFEQPRKNCVTDCSLCRSVPSRDRSPPYQALIDKSRHSHPSHTEKVD